MGIINVLPVEVSDKIAAGEVVERPASVVKELVENAIDAGALAITCEIRKGGITYIRVADNGSGIARDDAEVAFLRHATSKIQTSADLDAIFTLGFRGEALSSIGAVSKTELFTKRASDEVGTHVICKGGKIELSEDIGVPNGTTFIVHELFYNTPARMNFLKKDSSEAAAITDIMERFILSHPEISFRYILDGKDKYFTAGDNNLENCVYAVYGKSFAKSLIPINYENELLAVRGVIGKSDTVRPNRGYQSFFINKRYVKSMRLSMAVENAYKNQIMIGKHPMVVLNLEINPKNIDINVHPTKLDVKFARDDDVMRAVYHAVQNGLYAIPNVPQIERTQSAPSDFVKDSATTKNQLELLKEPTASLPKDEPSAGKQEAPETKPTEIAPVSKNSVEDYFDKRRVLSLSDLLAGENATFRVAEEPDSSRVERLTEKQVLPTYKKEIETPVFFKEPEIPTDDAFTAAWGFDRGCVRVIGQIFGTYILAEAGDTMIIADQHAAHERLKYEELKRELASRSVSAQMLLVPEAVELSDSEAAILRENASSFADMGFELEEFGDSTILVRATPEAIDPGELSDLIIELIDRFSDASGDVMTKNTERALYTIACKAAVKANHVYSQKELETLLDAVLNLENINTCPHGRPIIVTMTKKELEKEFKRIV